MTSSTSAVQLIASPSNTEKADALKALVLQSMFWRPEYLVQSAWLEHVPFAFWLVEAHRPRVIVELGTHHGLSYFSFCQAVDRLGVDARCFAVDTWKGDEHAGFYSEEVFAAVKQHNQERYSGFSRLVRSTFEKALGHFAPGSIDLLHIDGLHTLESVRRDFETWLPKLSDRAIVLMHDTNVRERGFGVSTFFETIRESYPNFEFLHGHGLGVVCVGKEAGASIGALLEANQDPAARHAVRDLFGRLGRGVADGFFLRESEKRILQLKVELGTLDSRVTAADSDRETLEQSILDLRGDLATRDQKIGELEKTIEDYARTLDSRFFELGKLTGDFEQARQGYEARETRGAAEIARLELIVEDYRRILDSQLLERAKPGVPAPAPRAPIQHRTADEEFRELANYTRKLERDHLALLNSTTWRLMEPVRKLLRSVRRQKKPPVFRPRF